MASVMENGIFNFSKGVLSDVAKIGQVDDMVIWVWENDPCCNVPCVHIVDEKTGGNKLNVCVKLEEASYLKSPYLKFYPEWDLTGELTEAQQNSFDNFMRQPHKTGIFATHYEYAVLLWDDNNQGEMELKRNDQGEIIIPNYKKIKDQVLTKEEALDVFKEWGIPTRYDEEKNLIELLNDKNGNENNVVEVVGFASPYSPKYKEIMDIIECYLEK